MNGTGIATHGTNVVAAGAVVSPVWLPYLQGVSEVFAALLPIAGVVWIVIQIVGYVRKNR